MITRNIFIILLFLPLVTGFRIEDGKSHVKEFPIGYIDITVESNTNRLFFKYDLGERCLSFNQLKQGPGERINTSSLSISIPVKDFQCANALVYRDFLSLLKADQYPVMEINISRESLIELLSDNSMVLHGVMFTIAGVSKCYDIICTLDDRPGNNNILAGTTQIMLSDLDIEPPVKFLGLVKIKDEIIVNFGFCLMKGEEAPQFLISDH